jgi:hypothetical protein
VRSAQLATRSVFLLFRSSAAVRTELAARPSGELSSPLTVFPAFFEHLSAELAARPSGELSSPLARVASSARHSREWRAEISLALFFAFYREWQVQLATRLCFSPFFRSAVRTPTRSVLLLDRMAHYANVAINHFH